MLKLKNLPTGLPLIKEFGVPILKQLLAINYNHRSLVSRIWLLGTVNNFFQIFLILVLTIFFAISCQRFLRELVTALLPNNQGTRVLELLNQNFHSYVINQLILAILIASARIPTFWLLNVPFATLLGLALALWG